LAEAAVYYFQDAEETVKRLRIRIPQRLLNHRIHAGDVNPIADSDDRRSPRRNLGNLAVHVSYDPRRGREVAYPPLLLIDWVFDHFANHCKRCFIVKVEWPDMDTLQLSPEVERYVNVSSNVMQTQPWLPRNLLLAVPA
jgi:hypothetical protein